MAPFVSASQARIRNGLTAGLAVACLWLSCSPWSYGQQVRSPYPLAGSIDSIVDTEAFRNAFWGILVVDLESGEVLYDRNSENSFVPASNTKLFTTAAALDALGPDYRYRTYVYRDGPVVNGVLQGNLIVRGSGDPTISGRFHDEDRTMIFRAWADSLKAAGISHIEGDIIGDDDVFDDSPYGRGWAWDDLEYYYAVEISGLSFNENAVDFDIAGQRLDMPGVVSWEPYGTDYVEVVNSTRTIPANRSIDEGYERAPTTNVIELSSLVPAGRTDEESLSVYNATQYFVHVLRETLLREGISVGGHPADVDDLAIKPDYTAVMAPVASYTSPPLSDIVAELNKESNNHYAEQVLKTLGVERPPAREGVDPGTAQAGELAIRQMLGRIGVDTTLVQLADGSGLSRHNLVTPQATTTLLRYMWNHGDVETRTAFYESLPAGGRDGTLETRFTEGPALGNVRAKTGSLSNVSALSGYVRTASGTPIAFAIMVNHYTTRTANVRQAQDRIVELIARYAP